jgi:hypothetical protein
LYVKPSNFPDFVAIEHRMLAYWQENEVFTKLREQISGKPPWSFVDGPITANNPMGVHHAWGRHQVLSHQSKPGWIGSTGPLGLVAEIGGMDRDYLKDAQSSPFFETD